MKFVVIFEDNPAAGVDVRRQLMPEHLGFLTRHPDQILAAGPLQSAEGRPAGGLWIVEADHGSDVDRLVKEDPFWPTGLRKSVRILAWSQVFAEGRPLIAT